MLWFLINHAKFCVFLLIVSMHNLLPVKKTIIRNICMYMVWAATICKLFFIFLFFRSDPETVNVIREMKTVKIPNPCQNKHKYFFHSRKVCWIYHMMRFVFETSLLGLCASESFYSDQLISFYQLMILFFSDNKIWGKIVNVSSIVCILNFRWTCGNLRWKIWYSRFGFT